MKYLSIALERAQQRLQRLETHKENVRANAGVLHNPAWLDERIELAQRRVAHLKQTIEETKG